MHVRNKTYLAFALTLTVILVFYGSIDIIHSENTLKQDFYKKNSEQLDKKLIEVEQKIKVLQASANEATLEEVISKSMALSNSEVKIAKNLKTNQDNLNESLNSIFLPMLKSLNFEEVILIDKKGLIIYSTKGEKELIFKFDAYLSSKKNSIFVDMLEKQMFISAPVFNLDNKTFLGSIVFKITDLSDITFSKPWHDAVGASENRSQFFLESGKVKNVHNQKYSEIYKPLVATSGNLSIGYVSNLGSLNKKIVDLRQLFIVKTFVAISLFWLAILIFSKRLEIQYTKRSDDSLGIALKNWQENVSLVMSELFLVNRKILGVGDRVHNALESSDQLISNCNEQVSQVEQLLLNGEVSIELQNVLNQEAINIFEVKHHNAGRIISHVEKIQDKLKVINDLAFQAKLLAFNATVEASRFGESGKYFKLVATEVSEISQYNAQLASNIKSILEEILQDLNVLVDDTNTKISQLHLSREVQTEANINNIQESMAIVNNLKESLKRTSVLHLGISDAIDKQLNFCEELNAASSLVKDSIGQLEKTNSSNSSLIELDSSLSEIEKKSA